MKSIFDNDIKNVLITGGAGFIGGNLVRKLLKESNANIYNLDKLSYCSDPDFQIKSKPTQFDSYKNRYFFLNIDLSSREDTELAIKNVNPDLVIHLAAESHVDRSIDSPQFFIQSNIVGTFNLLEASKNHWDNLSESRKKIFRFHHISTDEVFGTLGEHGYFNESTAYNPRSPYSASKASSDHLVRSWNETYGLPTLITNCSNNYGPFQFPEKLIPLAILKGIKKEEIPLYGHGNNIRDWIYVEDHLDAILLVLNQGIVGNTYCVGGGEEKTNKEVLILVCQLLRKHLDSNFDYTKLIRYVTDRPGHDFRYAIDSFKIRNDLGWKPKYSFEIGLENTFLWYLNNLNWTKKMLINSSYNSNRLGLRS